MKKQGLGKRISERVINFVVNRSKLSIVLSLLLGALIIPFSGKMTPDFSYRIWFSDEDPLLQKFDAFERQFGNDESVILIVHSPEGIFTKDSIQLLRNLTESMWLAPEVIRVESLINHNFTQVDGDDLAVDPFILNEDELTPEYLERKKDLALKDEIMPDYLVNKKANTAMIYARMKPALDKIPFYVETMHYTRELVKKNQDGKHQFYIAGSGAINLAFEEASSHDMETILPILLSLVVIFLIAVFRSVSGVIYPFVVILLSIFATFGYAGFSGITFNVMISAVPTTLIAICIADVVHILVSYYIFRRGGQDPDLAVRSTLEKNLVPTLLTSITTAIGFLSLAPTKIVPVANMGILDGFGTLVAWVFSIFLIVPLLKLLPIRSKSIQSTLKENQEVHLSPYAIRYTKLLEKNKRLVLVVSFVIVVLSFWVAIKNEVNSDPLKYFTDDVEVKVATDFMEAQIGGSIGAELVITSGVPDGIKNPDLLEKQDQFEDWLLSQSYISKVVSVVDILKSLNRSLNQGKQEFFKLEKSQDSIAQQLFLYTMSLPQGMDLNDRITLNNDATRITVMMDIHDSKTVLVEFERWENKAKELGLQAHVTGKFPLYQSMNGYVVDTFFSSISMALVLVSFLMVFIFGSWKVGLISMIPNTVPLIIGGALMTILKKPIDMGTVVVTSVCLGIAVDDTIHFIANFQKYQKQGLSIADSIVRVLTFTGPALLFTTMILVVGFGTMMFAQFIPNINFGIMTAVILSVALIVDLVLLPAILLCMKEPNGTTNENT